MNQSEQEIASLFDNMSLEYDCISDLWYSWLFSNLHFFISKDLLQTNAGQSDCCLDIGCGTGYQSLLFSMAGIKTEGIDISPALINVASNKTIKTFIERPLFDAHFPFVEKLHAKTMANISAVRNDRSLKEPIYRIASATALPYANESFKYVNCIGSVISFIENYIQAITEIARVLKPDGYFFLEFENKYNIDLIWPLIDNILLGKIGYEQNWKTSFKNLFSDIRKHIKVEYPFTKQNEVVEMDIWLFNTGKMIRELKANGLNILSIRSIHSVTNLIPSVLLDDPKPGSLKKDVFSILASLESKIHRMFPINRLGCSTYIFGQKGSGTIQNF